MLDNVNNLGAELIEELRLKRMTEQDEQEKRVLEKIKAKMDKIKANQQKLQGSLKEATNHYVGKFCWWKIVLYQFGASRNLTLKILVKCSRLVF